MECPSCGHVSKEEAPKFCCECGRRLPPAAPAPDSEKDPKATSVPEGEKASGQELKEEEEGGPQATSVPEGDPQAISVPEGDLQATSVPEGDPQATSVPEGDSQATSVPEGEKASGQELEEEEEGGPQATSVPEGEKASGQKLEEDGGPPSSLGSSDPQEELAQPSPQAWKSQKSKRKKQKEKNEKVPVSKGPETLCAPPSASCRLESPADLGVQDAALPQSPAQQGGPPSQPPPGAPEAASAGESPGSTAPQDQTVGGAPPGGKDPEGAGAPASASRKEGAAQELPPPAPQGDPSEPRNEPPASGATDVAAQLVRPGEEAEVQGETKQKPKQKAKQKPKPPGAPASPEHGQEAEPKGQAAVSGEKAKPGDRKKADRGHRGDAAAPKGEEGRKELEVPSSPLSPEEGVTVFFHAILSKDFNFNPSQHRLFIRGGKELGTPAWRLNVCELHVTKTLDSHGALVEGSTVLPKRLLDQPVPYKYVVVKGTESTVYEFIYKQQEKESSHVNRSLHMRSALLGSGDWHQYDDIICTRPTGKFWEIRDYFLKHFVDQMKKNVRGKQLAASVMLDRVLSVLQTWSAVNLRSFFTQFRQLHAVLSEPTIFEEHEKPWVSLNYSKEQVRAHLWECLQERMKPFLERSEDALPEDVPVRRKLQMGLVALHVAEELKPRLSKHHLGALCSLLCASASASSPRDLQDDLSLIFETSQRWRGSLLALCRRSMELEVSSWVGTLPVLHLCAGPPARQPGTQSEDVWAALEEIPFSEFRQKREHEKHLLQFMVGKKHLLRVDEALFRSWFSLLPLSSLAEYLQEFTDYLARSPARVLDCLLGTRYRLQGLKDVSLGNLEDVDMTLKMLLHLLDMFQDQVLEAPSVPSYLTACLKLHEAVCGLHLAWKAHELPTLSADIICRVIRLKPVADTTEAQGSATGTRASVGDVVQGALSTTRTWLARTFKQRMFSSFYATSVSFTYSQEIQVWRQLVELPFPEEHGWKASLLGDLAGRIQQEPPRQQIAAYCSTAWAAAGADDDGVSRCFENCAIEAVSSACQSQVSILEGLSHSDLRRFGTLVSAVVTKSWPRRCGEAVDNLAEVLRYLLTGPDVTHLFKLYGTDEKILAHITEDGKKLMATADSVFTKVAEDLLSGAVLVGQLELIRSHEARFLDIWELKRKSLSPQEKQHDMRKVLDYRWEELQFLLEERGHVDSLLKLCEVAKRWVQVDCGETEERHAEDLGGKRLNEVVMVRLCPTSCTVERVPHYDLSARVREMAARIHSLKGSYVFQTFWAEAARAWGTQEKEKEEEEEEEDEEEEEEEGEGEGEGERLGPLLDLESAYVALYRPCLSKFRKLYEDLKAGEVTFGEVHDTFGVFVDKYEDLTSDLRVMCALDPSDRGDWVRERVEQVREYHHLHRSARAARVLLDVRETLGLTGDFSLLDFVLRMTDAFENSRDETLGQIDGRVVAAIRLLQDLDEARCQCLQELALARELVHWVREAVEGVNELKVFVDLAFIFAGENDMDVDRVACFHDAVQGYSSLLYKLDASVGFHEFEERHLKELWKALENDPHLPSKLRDSARNLGWLKTVKESHGSVERSSLSLARTINSSGTYVIQAPAEGQQISADTVLHLLLPETHESRQELRSYSLEELKELMNKLMLMSGRKDHNSAGVEEFSEVFCNVQRLVQAFLSLYSAGSFLFRAWKVQVHCGQPEPVRMHFRLPLLAPLPLRGGAPLAPLLEALCRRMERFLDEWEAVVARKRAEHFYLNYYTAEQLVHLSVELARRPPGPTALAMLSFIKRQCTPRDVAKAFRDPYGDGDGDGRAATQELRTVMERLPILLISAPGLVDKLGVIMEQFLGCTRAFLPHCLDLEALGRGLARLAAMGGPPVTRGLPKGLQAGQPNLIVCGHSEVLPAALAVYMQSPEQPLPTYDEVLLCTPGTAFEEVALLLRRCLSPGAPGRRVYSLLFADQLGYEVARRAEALLRGLCTGPHREDFQLVLVCDCEREHCYLPSAFSQHRVPATPQAPLKAAQAYLARHYQVPRGTPSAAVAFEDRMCVGIVASARVGVGKSLYVKQLHRTLQRKFPGEQVPLKVIRLLDPQVDESQVLGSLLPFLDPKCQTSPAMFHLDVTSSVQAGVWAFLFKLLVLQYLMDSNGKMWLRSPSHLYVVEILEGHSALPTRSSKLRTRAPQFRLLDVFPRVTCRPPKEVMEMELSPEQHSREPGMDPTEFCSETFQRPFQYLRRFHQGRSRNLDTFTYQEGRVEGTPQECLQHLLLYCGVLDPSWAELCNFARFLNCQLRDCEASIFCNPEAVGDTLLGFKDFVVTFMICMARDFATPTLSMSDQSPGAHAVALDGVTEEDIAPFSLRRRWESEPHPYLFFNGDRTSMTFIGFHLESNQTGTFDAVDPESNRVIKRDVLTKELYEGLRLQGVPFNVDFDALPRHEKMERLCLALGIQCHVDPDDTYELTTDNMLKILAVEMRFRCGIPVIVMGETGCGKTRLIRFLSELRRGGADAETLQLVKVHGGTSADMIYGKVLAAEALAQLNRSEHGLDTVLFLDEANTTGAISCIKEVLCDRTVDGQPLAEDSGLHVIAACNPYRKHSPEMIARLEAAGLGYRVRAEETAERLGSIPLRQLVYRVHALPPSLVPLVWDFGQLNNATEREYTRQIVRRLVGGTPIGISSQITIANVLYASQRFMRRRENECSFVSLRDVERCMRVFRWFYDHSEMLLSKLAALHGEPGSDSPDDSDPDSNPDSDSNPRSHPVLWSLVLAIGVCYHASLEKQDAYRRAICKLLPAPFDSSKAVLDAITQTQDLFLEGVSLRKTVAKNLALKENVFMMVVCIELKIPLFLVGKPGSSKSLAKTIVADAMQGPAAPSELFRRLKQVYLVSFQCSPHSTPQGIVGTFKHCARLQQGRDLEQYVSVVVLDEVGLAEDSPQMPLKALHPLLEDGCIEDDPAPHKKVGFIGISNWALDPAKMNRGIFVSRGSPSQKELIESARGICASEPLVQERIQGYFPPLARAYEEVCTKQDKEFFGLRDYYSLIKMVFATAQAPNRTLSPGDIAQAVLRNFSGRDEIQALDIFAAHLPEAKLPAAEVSTLQLIRQNLRSDLQRAPGVGPGDPESRYLLVLTRNYVALQILQRTLFGEDQQPEIIFGSSFPRDQEYAQVCRNINRVKICMETGKMVVLLNLQNLYESLYDALNQYYVYLGGQKYVDLGLGTHRVKCRVHPDFRLIVIEEKDVVCEHFPIPLINRLEKHYLDLNTVLEPWQRRLVEELKGWVDKFIDVSAGRAHTRYSPSDVFIGYHADTCASVVLQVIERLGPGALSHECYQKVLEDAKLVLLDCATPDAIVRLSASALGKSAAQALSREYYSGQQHDSFADFLQAHLQGPGPEHHPVFTEVTTFSRLLTCRDCEMLGSDVNPTILSLQQFDTEHSFLKEVRNCLASTATRKVLIIQTDFEDGVHSAQLIASARYSAINEINKIQGKKACIFVYFVTKLSRMESGASYVGFHGGLWRSVHIDDLRRSTTMVADVTQLQDVTISQLFDPQPEEGREARSDQEEAMEVDADEAGAAVGREVDGPQARRGHRPALDCSSLLRSCIQSAVGLLRDPGECGQRNVRRVEILLGLLGEDVGSTGKASFAWAAQLRLHHLLQRQEESCVLGRKDWVAQEASNPDALQEAGTFRHTLWKRVQGAVTPLLASMVAVIDRDSNLELLAMPDTPAWVRELWMFIFSDTNLLSIPLVTNDARSNSDMAHILVQSHAHRPGEACGAVPFSWRIRDYVEELWVQAQYISAAAGPGPGPAGKLVEVFGQTPLGRFLARLPEEARRELLWSYLRDFLLLTMRVSTEPQLELLQMALWSCVQQLRAGSPEEPSLPWVHRAYQHFRVRLQNFSRILTIHPPVLDSLATAARSQDPAGPEMILDAWAAMACTELLTRDLLKPSPQAWLRAVKSLAVPLELLCSEGYVQGPAGRAGDLIREVRGPWTRIFSVALFVEHVLLGTEDHAPELRALVTDCVFSLDKCLQGNSDIKTLPPFSAVMAVLCECKDRASRAFTRFGIQPCPVCLGDPRSPVCLPCDHVFCQDCVRQWLTAGQMACPLCLTELPDHFSPTVSQEARDAIERHARFRRLCTGFFVDLVSTLCFKDNCPPSRDVVQALLALLFAEKTLLRDPPQSHTKSLSPFDDVVDKTPIIRSVVLKLLLKYSFPEVKGYIQDYLSLLERKPFLAQDKTELYVLFSSCLEDSIQERSSALPARDEATGLREDGQFLQTCLLRGRRGAPAPEASVECLQEMARTRLCLDRACEVLSGLQGGSEPAEAQRQFLQQVERFCTQSGNDWHRVYLVRRLASRQGMEFVQSFLQPGHPAQWVFPHEVLVQQEDLPGQMDRFLVHGLEYKAVRDAVGKAVLESEPPTVRAALEACRCSQAHQATYLLLALFQEVTVLYRARNTHLHPKQEQLKALCKSIEESQILSSDAKPFATALVTNSLPLLRTVGPGDSGLAGTVAELAVHAAATLLCGRHRILEPLRNLAFSPATMVAAFLPTMPEDMLAQARGWQGLQAVRWYRCPQGHLCAVGECGRPVQQSVCIDCGTPVGGQDHKSIAGFTDVQNEVDRTQTGHVLGSPAPGDEAVVSDRELAPAAFLLARLLTHLAMLWGAAHSPQVLALLIKPAVRDPGAFLQQHLQRDLRQLMRTLGKSTDDTVQAVHLVLSVLLREQHPLSGRGSFNFGATLSTKEQRDSWEKLLQALVLPELERLDKSLLEVNGLISQDERISSDLVARIVLGDPAAFLRRLPRASALHCSRTWSCRARLTVEHLRHVVEQKNGRESVPVLWRFLQKEAELRLVKFLPEILALQRDLVKWFQNVPEAEFQSIRGFIDSHGSGGLKQLLLSRVTLFLSTWNKLRRSLETQGEIKLPADYCRAPLDLDADFEVILPRRRGLGLCATALVSYLIGLHNDVVSAVERLSEQEPGYSVDASEVADLHVVSYEAERDLMPLILANCQYQVAQGGESLQELDLERIERQVTGRLLQGKPRLSLRGLPTLVYRRDWNYEHLFAAIRSRVPQGPLPHAAASALGGQLQSYSDACEALSLVEVTLGFLSTAGEDPDMDLNVYLQDKLRMGSQTEQVAKALHLHPCRLRHIIALWQLLSAHKSEQLLRLRKEPFREISAKYCKQLSPGSAKLLRGFLNQSSLDVFLLELHEMILLKLKNPHTEADFNPDWSLRDTLVSYMETKEGDIPPEMEGQFPEEILLCHCVSAWKMAAELKRARQTR